MNREIEIDLLEIENEIVPDCYNIALAAQYKQITGKEYRTPGYTSAFWYLVRKYLGENRNPGNTKWCYMPHKKNYIVTVLEEK